MRRERDGWAETSGQYARTKDGLAGKVPEFSDVNTPPAQRGDAFYLNAFWDLSSERSFGQVIGPIPWSKAIYFAERCGLDREMVTVFVRVIRSLDGAYLSWNRDQLRHRTGR